MNLKPSAGLFLLLLLITPALAADTEVVKLWEQNMGPHDVNSVDTDETGTFTYYGLSNGSVGAYSAAGVSQWITSLNGSIRKIKKSSYSDYLVAMTSLNETYLLESTSGTIMAYVVGIPTRDNWIRAVDISRDGDCWSVTFDNSSYLYHNSVSVAANITPFSRTYYGAQSWLNASLDPHAEYVILTETANTSVHLFRAKPYQGFPYALNDTPTAYQWLYNTWLYRVPLDMTGAAGNKQFNITSNASDATNPATIYVPYGHALSTLADLKVTAEDATPLGYNKSDIISLSEMIYTIEPVVQPKNETWYPRNVTMDYTGTHPGFEFLADGRGYLFGGGPARGFTLRTSDSGLVGELWDVINNTVQLQQNAGAGTMFNNNLYYISTDGVPWRSLDGGSTWANNTTGIGAVGGLNIIGNNKQQKIFLLSGTTVFTSTDGDCYTRTNTSVFPGIASIDYAPVAINQRTGEMWAIPEHGVTPKLVFYSSTDGNVWTIVNATFAPTGTQHAALVWAGDELIYAGGTFPASNDWYNSSDGGVTWQSHAAAAWTARYAMGIAHNGTSGKVYIAGGDTGADGVWDLTRTATGLGYQKNWSLVNVKKPIDGDYRNYVFYGNNSATSNSTTAIFGTTQLTGTIGAEEQNSTLKYLMYNSSAALTGTAQTQSIPEGGGVVTIGTTTNVTTLTIGDSGFTTGFTTGASSGNSNVIAASDAATFVVDGRALGVNIYDITGTLKGTYTAGGNINSADIDDKTALWLVAGGDDGKVYVFSKDSTSAWSVAYSGDSMDPILATAMSMRGEYAAVGRKGGAYEYYAASASTTSSSDITNLNSLYPQNVQFTIVDRNGNTQKLVTVNATMTASTISNTNWWETLLGIPSTASPINSTVLYGVTDDNGVVVFPMVASGYYRLDIANATLGIDKSINIQPAQTSYIIVVQTTATIPVSNKWDCVNATLFTYAPTDATVYLNLSFNDTCKQTTGMEFYIAYPNRTLYYWFDYPGSLTNMTVNTSRPVNNVNGAAYVWGFVAEGTWGNVSGEKGITLKGPKQILWDLFTPKDEW